MTTSNVLKFFSLTANAQRQILDELMSIRTACPGQRWGLLSTVQQYESVHNVVFDPQLQVVNALAVYRLVCDSGLTGLVLPEFFPALNSDMRIDEFRPVFTEWLKQAK